MHIIDRELWMFVIEDIGKELRYFPAAVLIGILGYGIFFGICRLFQKNIKQHLLWLGWLIFLPMLLIITIFERETGSRQGVSLKLFETFGSTKMNAFVMENILLFIPLGILSAKTFPLTRWLPASLFFGGLCSLLIETIQLITQRGYFQVDDIMLNSLGMGVGCLFFWAGRKLWGQ